MMQIFRIGKIALSADVEKAFLKVHLHEDDRDATRFLWLYDTSRPPTTKIWRSTETADVDQEFANELNENLCVDNLLICAESAKEGIEKYTRAKKIFNELNINLREFVSNDKKVNQFIKKEDSAKEGLQKVLGIQWNTMSDTLEIKCNMPNPAEITKRSVLQANALVYDPKDSRGADRMGGTGGEDADGDSNTGVARGTVERPSLTPFSLSLFDTLISLRLFRDYGHRCHEDAL
uniref:Uncharacterized protein n=1 Tax=Haemonchus contortus TaxID=6289 RepID=A0A7I4XUK7_HAECO